MLKIILASFAASLLFSSTVTGAIAQATTSEAATTGSATSATSKQPPPLAPRPLNLPKPIKYQLKNGLSVILLEDHRVPFVTAQLGIRVGDKHDPKGLEGLSTLTADMLTEGTKTRSSQQIAEQIDSLGAGLKGSSDSDFSVVSGSSLSEHTDKFFDLLSDIVLNPVFPEDELKLTKTNLAQALQVKRTDPDFLGSERFNKVVFGAHPYATIAPSPESIGRLTRDKLVEFHATRFLPNASTLVVVGDFNTDKLKALLESKLGNWKRGEIHTTTASSPPAIKGTRIYLVDRPGSVQSTVKIGNVGIKKNDPDYFATVVANQILGGSANSRLFLNIREQKGYTYGAYSGFATRQEPGEFSAGASVRTQVTAPSITEFLYELNRIRTAPVTESELDTARKYLVGNFQLGFETQGGVAARLAEQALYDLPDNYLDEYTQKVLSVSPEDVRRVSQKNIDYDNLVITIVGDAKQIEPELRRFFPVEIYDASGKLVRSEPKVAQPAG